MNLNIFRKDNIVCVSLVNVTICLNSIRESNVANLRNCTSVLPVIKNKIKIGLKTCEKIGCQTEFKKKKKKNQIQTSFKFQFEKLKKVKKWKWKWKHIPNKL